MPNVESSSTSMQHSLNTSQRIDSAQSQRGERSSVFGKKSVQEPDVASKTTLKSDGGDSPSLKPGQKPLNKN